MVNGKFIFIQHLPLTAYHYFPEFKFFIVAIKYDVSTFFQRFSKTNSEKYGADHFAFFAQSLNFLLWL
jgi:hypothetical protein